MRLESELYRLYVSGKPYCDKCRSLLFNLQDENNKRPLEMLLDRQISPEEFVKLDVREIASDDMKKQREQFEEMGMWQKRTDWDNEEVKAQGSKYKGLFMCEECGSDKTGFIQVQIDRADEPMHCFIYCYDCKARFTKH